MINVSSKSNTLRTAKARALVVLNPSIVRKIKNSHIPKGNVLATARIAGILSAKNTSQLIPLCHNIMLEHTDLSFSLKRDSVVVESAVTATSKTGVEMEALVAVSMAALTIYDMCKMFSKNIEIKDVYLLEKKGGRSGEYKRKG